MAYAYLTYGQARMELARRLSGATGSLPFWTDAELGLYFIEALRVWSSLTAYWRERGAFSTEAGTAFYDLNTKLSSLFGQTVLDRNLVLEIQYHLLEVATGNSWTGTEMFALDEVTQALQNRRNQFLVETGVLLTHASLPMPPPLLGRVVLSDSIIDVRRAAWQPVTGPWSQLWRVSEHEFTAFQQNWETEPDVPSAYSVLEVPPLQMQLGPPPGDAGTLDLVSVNAGPVLDPTAGVAVGVPDDWAWAVKWGALADLLSKDGMAFDPNRAAYCEARYRQAAMLARQQPVVLLVEVNGTPLFTNPLEDLDAARPGWQGSTSARPDDVGLAGVNLIGFSPVPDAVYGVAVDVVRKAPVPVADGDFIQLGREDLDAVLGYAEHIASFKMGGAEFQATARQLDSFMNAAAVYNERVAATEFAYAEGAQTELEEAKRARRKRGFGLGPLRSMAGVTQ